MQKKLLRIIIFVSICASVCSIPNFMNEKRANKYSQNQVMEVLSDANFDINMNTAVFNPEEELQEIKTKEIIFTNNIINEKVADISQKYTETDKYFYINKNTTIKFEDNIDSKTICDIEYGDYIHCIGKDLYNNEFYKIEINNKIGFVLTEDVTEEIIFKNFEKKLYAKNNIKAYEHHDMNSNYIEINKISSINIVGFNEQLNLYKININNKNYYIDPSDTSEEMQFTSEEKLMYNKDKCNIYSIPDTSSEILKTKSAYNEIEIVGFSEDWAKVKLSKNKFGYIEKTILTKDCPKALKAVHFAYKMIGVPYVWGGTSTKGTDCSGLTYQCYQYAGIKIPRTASTQNGYGTKVSYSEAKPGDLITWSGKGSGGRVTHVGIYVGDGMMIHAGSKGVCKVSVSDYKKHTKLVSVIRVTEK